MVRVEVLTVILYFVSGNDAASTLQQDSQVLSARIFNGNPVALGEIPSIVNLLHQDTHQCGGSIIAEMWVVTAAHCIYNDATKTFFNKPDDFTVAAGTIEENSRNDKRHEVSDMIPHPKYSMFDIALIKLKQPLIIWPSIVNKINTGKVGLNEIVYTAGWGEGSNQGLKKLWMRTVACRGQATLFLNYIVDQVHICATATSRGGATGRGDLGGPLINSKGELVGILNGHFADDCTTKIFTRVDTFSSWIRQVTGLAKIYS